jgi:hypothetical protein
MVTSAALAVAAVVDTLLQQYIQHKFHGYQL